MVARVSHYLGALSTSVLLMLTACAEKTPPGQLLPLADDYAAALCTCWELFDFGDLYFESQQQCIDVGPSLGAGLVPWDA